MLESSNPCTAQQHIPRPVSAMRGGGGAEREDDACQRRFGAPAGEGGAQHGFASLALAGDDQQAPLSGFRPRRDETQQGLPRLVKAQAV